MLLVSYCAKARIGCNLGLLFYGVSYRLSCSHRIPSPEKKSVADSQTTLVLTNIIREKRIREDQTILYFIVSLKQTTLASLPFLIIPHSQDSRGSQDSEPLSDSLKTSIRAMFPVTEVCVVESEICQDLPSCYSSPWSSLAPDPKSEFNGFDKSI